MRSNRHQSLRRYRAPIFAGVVLGIVNLLPPTPAAVAVIGALAATAVVLLVLLRGVPRRMCMPEPWTLAGAGTVVSAYATAAHPGAAAEAGALLAASLLSFAAATRLVRSRLRERYSELLIESGLVAAAFCVLSWALLLGPHRGGESGVDSALLIAAGIAGAALLATGWLMTVDREDVATPAALVLFALGANTTIPILGLVSRSLLHQPIALSVIVAALAAVVLVARHPQRELLSMPALIVHLGVVQTRLSIALTSMLVGPGLICLDVATGFSVSMPVVATATAALSVAMGLHIMRLMSRWDNLEHDVHHDALTGLPNREMFHGLLSRTIEQANSEKRMMAVLFLDLDRFKNVNDSLGHAAGNALLREVAQRLRATVTGEATVARLAGDEFALLIPHVSAFRHTEAIGKSIVEAFSRPFDVARRQLYVSPSIGAAHYPADGMTPGELLEHADLAMYRAKERGRNQIQLYTAERRSSSVTRVDLESALHRALEQQQLNVVYQPQVNIHGGALKGVEALLRWDHPTYGVISPEDFIPLAEESGLISEIGEWVLTQACLQARHWQHAAGISLRVAVNLSPRQFQLRRIQDVVARTLRTTGLDARMLELELTEGIAVQDAVAVSQTLSELRAMGVRTAVDDFGMGHSGLDYLGRFQFDSIKIDRSFVNRIDGSGGPIVTAVIAMAKGLGCEVVAEGVETQEQVEFLRMNGCSHMQGYFFSRPLVAHQMDDLLATWRERQTAPISNGKQSIVPVRSRLLVGR